MNGSAPGWSPPRPDVTYATKEELAHDMIGDRELSSGKLVRLRRGTLAQFVIEDGECPNPLRVLVASIESGARNKQLQDSPESLTVDDMINYEQLVWRFIAHYLDEPTMSADEVPRHFSPTDREEMFTYIIHGDVLAGIARFRRQAELLKLEGADDGGSAGES
jgi:hypothetical protein